MSRSKLSTLVIGEKEFEIADETARDELDGISFSLVIDENGDATLLRAGIVNTEEVSS